MNIQVYAHSAAPAHGSQATVLVGEAQAAGLDRDKRNWLRFSDVVSSMLTIRGFFLCCSLVRNADRLQIRVDWERAIRN